MKDMIKKVPVPTCRVGTDGNIIEANDLMRDVIVYSDIEGANFFTLTGVRRSELVEAYQAGREIVIERNNKKFGITANSNPSIDEEMTVFFVDRTERETYKELYENIKPVVLFISIDNYDELISSVTTDSRRAVPTEVDRILHKWAENYDAPILSIEEDEYVMFTTRGKAREIMDDDF